LLAVLVPVQTVSATASNGPSYQAAMQAASQSRHVPLELIEAIAYVNTHWDANTPIAADGGVGPMHITPKQMDGATRASGHGKDQIAADVAANLDAGAALLAQAHTSGTSLDSWFSATASTQGPQVAKQVYGVLSTGVTSTTSTGETITLAPQAVSPATSAVSPATSTDYSGATWVPADPGNFSVANRAHDYPIDMIIIHDTETTYGQAIQLFQTPGYAASAHYVVSTGGAITQMVLEKDIAWHAGNWDYNTRAIGIEHEGFAYAQPTWYTTAQYQASAHLAASICERWGVPMDRTHVIGHYQVPDPNNPGLYGGSDHHTDPGPYWDWNQYMSDAQTYANALPSPPHMMVQPQVFPTNGGATITWDGRTCHLPIANYTVVLQPGNITQTVSGTTTQATFTGLTNGTTYTVTVTATNADGSDSNSTTLIPSAPCTTPTLTAAPPTQAGTGSSVTFTGATSACTNPNYRFWIQAPDGTWNITQDYSTSNTFTWAGSDSPNSYHAEVDVRQQTSSVAYDAVANMPYATVACSGARLSPNQLSPEPPGTTVVLTGSANCLGTPEYRFWKRPPGGSWGIVQDYSPTSTYSWNTTGSALGTYYVEVDVRNHGAAAPYETVANISYTLGPQQCHNPTLTANPTSGSSGSSTVFTSTSTGCANPRYRFWIAPPAGSWSIVQDYSPTSTYNWTAISAPGSYRVEVDVRDQTSSNTYDAVNNLAYAVTGCTSAHIATDKPSPQLTGTAAVTLTGSATCPGTPDYRFWIRQPGGAWTIVQDYSPTATYSWNTAALPAGTYSLEVDVRDHGSTSTYEAVGSASFTLSGCISAALTPNPASPQAHGTTITLTASATCTGTPQYRFWVRAPGGAWTVVRDYASGNTFGWTPAAAGTYSLEVDVRNAGSAASYEAVANQTYVVS
jgi:hypothetical protein